MPPHGVCWGSSSKFTQSWAQSNRSEPSAVIADPTSGGWGSSAPSSGPSAQTPVLGPRPPGTSAPMPRSARTQASGPRPALQCLLLTFHLVSQARNLGASLTPPPPVPAPHTWPLDLDCVPRPSLQAACARCSQGPAMGRDHVPVPSASRHSHEAGAVTLVSQRTRRPKAPQLEFATTAGPTAGSDGTHLPSAYCAPGTEPAAGKTGVNQTDRPSAQHLPRTQL